MKSLLDRLLFKQRSAMFDKRGWLQQLKGGEVALETDESTGIATIRLEQPAKKNAFTGHMMVALEEAVLRLESWETGKGLVVYGAGHNFCSGGDLSSVRQIADPTSGYHMSSFMQNTLSRLKKLPLVSVALIEGAGALGGGAEIALACDWRLLAPGCAGIGFVHQRMGIAPAWGGATWLTHAVGYRRALELMTTGRIVSGQEAIDLGLADGLLSTEEPLSEALDWLSRHTQGPTHVVRTIKLMAINSSKQDLESILEVEKKLFSPLWGGPANIKALESHIKHRL